MNFSSDPINTVENLVAKNKTKSISIYLVVLIGLFTALGSLPSVKTDISSQSRGIIRSTTDNVPLSSLVNGKVIRINLKNNRMVYKGDTLIVLTQESLNAEKQTNQNISQSLNARIYDLTKILTGITTTLKTPELQQEWESYSSKMNELENKVAQAKIAYDRNKILFDKAVISRAEFEKFSFDYLYTQQSLASLSKSQKSIWQNQKRELQNQLQNLDGTLQKIKIEFKNYVIIAPITGTIEGFSGIQIGSFLNASQLIANISSIDSLIVESSVSPSDIGLIKKGQKVKYQIDAFNYNQWGLLEGIVTDIDHNITMQGEKAFFNVRSSLKSTKLQLKSGYKAKVSKGMTLTTRYIITKRSLFDLLFDKVDDWLNPKIK
ncbi:HlyD family efflux transporter periplasmic adaptor subunit [Daejeonella sp.]|uniref:HlyD family secretion protein n=1 Tax=Daejeonella sp. TaxID=2805397 RepID=UPI0025B8D512|nr:HlyD family efflux transporter periplasmic adaptor subunit [Daejeonella sp.]